MNKICTSVEQSKKLVELGIDVNTADMHYNNGSCKGVDYTEHFSAELIPYQEALHLMKIHKTNFMFQVIPCWSLSALLGLMPEIHGERPKLDTGRIQTDKYYVEYPYHERTKKDWCSTKLYDEPLDAVFQMVCWLKENDEL